MAGFCFPTPLLRFFRDPPSATLFSPLASRRACRGGKDQPKKTLDERVGALEDQLKQTIEITNSSNEEIRDLRTATRKLEKDVAELRMGHT